MGSTSKSLGVEGHKELITYRDISVNMPVFRRRQREMADGKGDQGHSAPPPPTSAFAGAAPMAGPSAAAMGPPPSYEQSEHMTKGPMMQQQQGVYPPLPPNPVLAWILGGILCVVGLPFCA